MLDDHRANGLLLNIDQSKSIAKPSLTAARANKASYKLLLSFEHSLGIIVLKTLNGSETTVPATS